MRPRVAAEVPAEPSPQASPAPTTRLRTSRSRGRVVRPAVPSPPSLNRPISSRGDTTPPVSGAPYRAAVVIGRGPAVARRAGRHLKSRFRHRVPDTSIEHAGARGLGELRFRSRHGVPETSIQSACAQAERKEALPPTLGGGRVGGNAMPDHGALTGRRVLSNRTRRRPASGTHLRDGWSAADEREIGAGAELAEVGAGGAHTTIGGWAGGRSQAAATPTTATRSAQPPRGLRGRPGSARSSRATASSRSGSTTGTCPGPAA